MSMTPAAASAPVGEQQRIAGQERRDDDAGLEKYDQEQQRVDPEAISRCELEEMPVDVQDHVERRHQDIHGAVSPILSDEGFLTIPRGRAR